MPILPMKPPVSVARWLTAVASKSLSAHHFGIVSALRERRVKGEVVLDGNSWLNVVQTYPAVQHRLFYPW